MTQELHMDILRKLLNASSFTYSVTLMIKTPEFSATLSYLQVGSIDGNKIMLDDDDKINTSILLEKILEIKIEDKEDGSQADDHYLITVI